MAEFPKRRQKKGYLFTDKFKGKMSKSKMIESWKKVIKNKSRTLNKTKRRNGARP